MYPNLKNLSLDISEQEYRDMKALNYSRLAGYVKNGFTSLFKEEERTQAIMFGSAVDCIMTRGETAFMEAYARDYEGDELLSSDAEEVCKRYAELTGEGETMDMEVMERLLREQNYLQKFREDTRRAKVESWMPYICYLKNVKDKMVLRSEDYDDVLNVSNALTRMHEFEPFLNEGEERYYQLKFRSRIDGIDVKCMVDCIIVDHKNKTVTPIDLKTSKYGEYQFPKAFLEWHYDIQARLYWHIMKSVMDNDASFDGYELLPFTFIVCNRKSLKPLRWVFSQCSSLYETRMLTERGDVISFPDIRKLIAEVNSYLEERPAFPDGIDADGKNDIWASIAKGERWQY